MKKKTIGKLKRGRRLLPRYVRPETGINVGTSASCDVSVFPGQGELQPSSLTFTLVPPDESALAPPESLDRVVVRIADARGDVMLAVLDLRTFEELVAPFLVAPRALGYLRPR
jgi:hypothetical protein